MNLIKRLSVLLIVMGFMTVSAAASRIVPVSSSVQLTAALASALPGDTIQLAQGTYPGAFTFSHSGNAAAPVTITAAQDAHATITGSLLVYGDWLILKGLDFTNPGNTTSTTTPLAVWTSHIQVLNNNFHVECNVSGVGAFFDNTVNGGIDQVYYGNIFYYNGCNPQNGRHPHNLYIQNDLAVHGYKIVENNIVVEAGCALVCFSIHMYGEAGQSITGIRFLNNKFWNADILLGGTIAPSQDEFNGNTAIGGTLQFGYRLGGTQARIFNSSFSGNRLWNVAQTWNAKDGIIAVNNEFMGGSLKTLALLQQPNISNNRSGGSYTQDYPLAVPGTIDGANVITQNRYDPNTYYVSVFVTSVVNLPGRLSAFNPRDLYGAPAATGINSIDLDPGVWVIRVTALPPPTNTPTPTNTATSTPSPTPTNTATFTNTPTLTNTPTDTPSPTFTNTPTATNTATYTNTPTDTPSPTPTDTATFTPTATPTDTPTSTPIPTDTPTATATDTSTATETNPPTDEPTATPTPRILIIEEYWDGRLEVHGP